MYVSPRSRRCSSASTATIAEIATLAAAGPASIAAQVFRILSRRVRLATWRLPAARLVRHASTSLPFPRGARLPHRCTLRRVGGSAPRPRRRSARRALSRRARAGGRARTLLCARDSAAQCETARVAHQCSRQASMLSSRHATCRTRCSEVRARRRRPMRTSTAATPGSYSAFSSQMSSISPRRGSTATTQKRRCAPC